MPNYWEILGLVFGGLGVIGFLMTLPTFLHYCYGQPALEAIFDDASAALDDGLHHVLLVLVRNTAVTNRLLLALGVNRLPVESLTAWLEIREAGSGTIVVPEHPVKLGDPDSRRMRVRLPGGIGKAVVVVDTNSTTGARALDTGQTLQPGQYGARLNLVADGRVYEVNGHFVASSTKAYWRVTACTCRPRKTRRRPGSI